MQAGKADIAEHVAGRTTVRSVSWRDYAALLRPAQWIKNVVVLAGPAAALRLSDTEGIVRALTAFVAFCLVASAGYALNDVLDARSDARHPTKRSRPVARGAVTPTAAVLLAAGLLIAGVWLSAAGLNRRVTLVLGGYFVLSGLYSLVLKDRVILDVVVLAMGFVMRAWAGTLAVDVHTSHWLIACVFTLCLFMGFGKRRCEITLIGDATEASTHRPTLLRYTPDLLNHLITVSAGIAVITFLLYTMDSGGHPPPFPKDQLFYTLPVVVYGVFRFAMLTEMGRYAGPTEIVLRDRPLLATILLWVLLALLIAYQTRVFGEGGITAWLGGR